MKLLGTLRLARPIRLAVWSLGSVMLGAGAVQHIRPGWAIALAAVLLGGILLQGYITHAVNDIFDWASGTDRENTAWLSGGSQAVQQGLLDPLDLRRIALIAVASYLALLVAISVWRGYVFLVLGLVALTASVAYSLPPLRLGYRPLLGEWLGMFPAIAGGVLAAGYAAGGALTPTLWGVAVVNGVLCNASVMEHHLADIPLDWDAVPRKRTSPAYWQMAMGRQGSEVATFYALLVAFLSLGLTWLVSWRFFPTALLALIAAAIAKGTRVGEARDMTRRDGALKGIALLNALVFFLLGLAAMR